MIRALVFDTDAPFRREEGGPGSALSGETRLAGLSLVRRAILMAWKAGARHVTLVARDAEAAKRWSATEGGLPVLVTVAVGSADVPRPEPADQVLILSGQVLADPPLLNRLLEASYSLGRPVAALSSAAGCEGPAVLPAGDLQRALSDHPDPAAAVRSAAGRADHLTADGAFRWLAGPAALRDADRHLYRDLTSVSDGYLDRVLNRHVSRWFTRRIINLPISPNQVTLFHFTLGMVATWLFSQPLYWQQVVGAGLLQLSVALDCTDGEVARLKYQFSKVGGWLDVWADNIVTVALFCAVARSAAATLGVPLALRLGGLAVAGVLMCMLVIYSAAKLERRRRPDQASRHAATSRLSGEEAPSAARAGSMVDAVINEATSRDFTVLVVAAALFGRLDWLAWAAGIGSHVFWVAFALLQLKLLRTPHAQSS